MCHVYRGKSKLQSRPSAEKTANEIALGLQGGTGIKRMRWCQVWRDRPKPGVELGHQLLSVSGAWSKLESAPDYWHLKPQDRRLVNP